MLTRFRRLGRLSITGLLAGAIAGFVVGGIGGRFAMRLLAMLAGSSSAGAVTESGGVIGEVTQAGTRGLLLGTTIVGGVVGLIYMGIRQWLPGSRRWKPLTFGIFVLLIFGGLTFEGEKRDFLLVPPLLGIVLFSSLFILYGLVVALVAERFEPDASFRADRSVARVIGYFVMAALYGLGLIQTILTVSNILEAAG